MTDQLLFVCHANLCRSPMAEFIARRVLAGTPVRVSSAGTDAVPGRPMHPYAAVIAAAHGADPTPFRTRRLSVTQLTEATVVLTATRRQRSVCVTLAPSAVRRIFTIRQFARLAAAADPPASMTGWPLRAVLDAAVRARSRLQPAPEAEDLADPIGGTAADFQRCAEEIERSVTPIGRLIAATGSVPGSGLR